jgi:hypothetical protein
MALIVIGRVASLFGGITYKKQETVLSVGPSEAKTTEHKRIPLPPVVGVSAIVSGIGILVAKRRATKGEKR